MTINFTEKQMIDCLKSIADYEIHLVGCLNDYGGYDIKGYIAVHKYMLKAKIYDWGICVSSPFYEIYKILMRLFS